MDFDQNRLEEIITESIPKIKNKKGSFCISSSIPSRWLVEEEGKWDKDLEYRSIKNKINGIIVERIKKETEKAYSASNANFRIIFNLKENNFEIKNEHLFIFGRYEKYSRELAQTKWVCRSCRGKGCEECDGKGRHYLSLEEVMGEFFKKEFKCKDYSLHASGREDVNVENHAGRPFVLELIDPGKSDGDLKKIKKELENDGRVKVKDLKTVNRNFIELVSNSHFNKSYIAEIESEKEFRKKDLETIEKLNGKILHQRTPNRVKHRRADKIRRRKILSIKILNYEKNKMKLEIITEPGTYIKELISSDESRTKPSISGLLNCKVECKELIVSKIFDEFLDSIES